MGFQVWTIRPHQTPALNSEDLAGLSPLALYWPLKPFRLPQCSGTSVSPKDTGSNLRGGCLQCVPGFQVSSPSQKPAQSVSSGERPGKMSNHQGDQVRCRKIALACLFPKRTEHCSSAVRDTVRAKQCHGWSSQSWLAFLPHWDGCVECGGRFFTA